MRVRTYFLAAALASFAVGAAAQSAPGLSCQGKREDITRNLDEAKARGQKQRTRGLEKALSEVQAHCTDEKLQADYQRRIQRQEKAVAERERDLEDAQRNESAKKVEKRKSKLLEEQAKLQRLKDAPYATE